MTLITRFAPSPTGPLHLGHAYSALLAHDLAKAAGGNFLLRIEDIDQSRARAHWEAQIYEDLAWLGIDWPHPVMRQSDRMAAYEAALDALWSRGLLYACTCNRRDIAAATSAPQEGAEPVYGPDGLIYPGTCRTAGHSKGSGALRLDMRKALENLGNTKLSFTENGQGPNAETGKITLSSDQLMDTVGDVVLARRDMGTSYHLSVVLDDDAQGVTLVPRGADLFDATYIHVVLQALLGLPTPLYHHHRLIRDDSGKRLAKRDDARAIALYRENGATPDEIREIIGL
ncbi:tRNA glutamyl-Q(34) synthetase GluQRS [Sulfitobacter sp. KE29]|uniref:tRNA glutamyl-Q(34) synthetase GluQRS n=1 Tax=Sulfitobacter TaxID=60136 RepID=UPI0007C254A1|nr:MULTISPECIES: tRNA glutamyl-Q(34) synthetase GluQRS [Sulfitobacter]KZY50595.1 tRNA glutamyl-Q synthetase [Sulfitobacter sp. HI0054]MBO9437361.1 tRNA glutamyl-Q(34) synthetase GluQRS [Sulfitobacter sp. R18_2]MDF3419210.1 tRNA glutamyl-Q(34) synthetase GluQRS [Sulfitobacter sp. Ks38]MDF3426692.1 tRNA glutamyl-Q(34) synthetase GluQRS [Sulfitobacter sp. KE29]MDF3430273.1 tRNA glutamyl-Q(34) synthetase GluQRS [Sulfitobacter sp. S46]